MATIDNPEKKKGLRFNLEDLDIYLKQKKKESVMWQYITPGGLRAFRAAVVMYLLQAIVPEDQRWMYYIVLLHFLQDFYDPIYVLSALVIPVLLLFPTIPAGYIYGATMLFDFFKRTKTKEDAEKFQQTENSLLLYNFLFSSLFSSGFDLQPLVPVLEACLGPIGSWSYVLIPLLPGLLILAVDRGTINGFIPEGTQGTSAALTFNAVCAIFPRWFQWLFFFAFSFPDPEYPAMFVEWMLYTAAWINLGISLVAAYVAHLLINQYPHVNTLLQRQGGGPSTILRGERLGSLWFVITSIALHVLKPGIAEVVASLPLIIPGRGVTLLADLPYIKFLLKLSSQTSAKFTHQSLDGSDSLRLLRLLPQPRFARSQIQCDMIHATLDCAPSYIAISYTWDDPSKMKEMKEIIINGSPFPVSPNIYSLLLAKRSSWRTVVLWIDSICINQVDNKEKTGQVALMRRIFEEASCTVGWLGDNESAGKGFGSVNKFHNRPAKETPGIIDRFWAIFARPLSDSIADDSLVEWDELENLCSNPWFERVWIVQEIAVSKNTILRYGNEEIEWKKFATILFALLFTTFRLSEPISKFWESNGLVNALIMENIRSQVENVEFLKLKDMLKLGLRFNATLPIDKVYGLLGIVQERGTPFLHPSLSRTGSLGVVNSCAGHMVNDAMKNVRAVTNMMGILNNSSNTRQGRALAVPDERGLRNFIAFYDDIKRSLENLKRFKEGKPDMGNGPADVLPDYSEKSTAEKVYTDVARELVREGDLSSLFRLAGIGQSRNETLESLPSWVPDWSINLEIYLLPRTSPSKRKGSKDVKDQKSCVRDGGSKILHVRGFVVGTVSHLSCLSEDAERSSEDVFQQSKKDFDALADNFWEAWQMALTHTGSRYAIKVAVEQEAGGEVVKEKTALEERFGEAMIGEENVGGKTFAEEMARGEDEQEGAVIAEHASKVEDLIESAFWRTVMANNLPKENRSPSEKEVNIHKSNVLGCRPKCAIQAVLLPDITQDYWKRFEEMNQGQSVLEHKTAICEEYLRFRRLQSSANSKFAHLVRNEVIPSFASYRLRFEYSTKDGKEVPICFRGSKPEDPVPVSAPDDRLEWAKQTAKRARFGVPGRAEVGDVVVWLEEEGLCLTLRPTKGVDNDRKLQESVGKNGLGEEGKEDLGKELAFRFVGEAYIHELAVEKVDEHGETLERWFKLW